MELKNSLSLRSCTAAEAEAEPEPESREVIAKGDQLEPGLHTQDRG